MKNFSIKKHNQGFAMLFTVLIITLILSIAIGISNLSLKQMILSSLAKDSQISFYEADTAVECGLYYDSVLESFPAGTDGSTALSQIMCGNKIYSLDGASVMDYLIYKQNVTDVSKPCSALYFDKLSSPGTNVVQGRGYNICDSTPRQVERALEVRY
jgi:hypothetical protein